MAECLLAALGQRQCREPRRGRGRRLQHRRAAEWNWELPLSPVSWHLAIRVQTRQFLLVSSPQPAEAIRGDLGGHCSLSLNGDPALQGEAALGPGSWFQWRKCLLKSLCKQDPGGISAAVRKHCFQGLGRSKVLSGQERPRSWETANLLGLLHVGERLSRPGACLGPGGAAEADEVPSGLSSLPASAPCLGDRALASLGRTAALCSLLEAGLVGTLTPDPCSIPACSPREGVGALGWVPIPRASSGQ